MSQYYWYQLRPEATGNEAQNVLTTILSKQKGTVNDLERREIIQHFLQYRRKKQSNNLKCKKLPYNAVYREICFFVKEQEKASSSSIERMSRSSRAKQEIRVIKESQASRIRSVLNR